MMEKVFVKLALIALLLVIAVCRCSSAERNFIQSLTFTSPETDILSSQVPILETDSTIHEMFERVVRESYALQHYKLYGGVDKTFYKIKAYWNVSKSESMCRMFEIQQLNTADGKKQNVLIEITKRINCETEKIPPEYIQLLTGTENYNNVFYIFYEALKNGKKLISYGKKNGSNDEFFIKTQTYLSNGKSMDCEILNVSMENNSPKLNKVTMKIFCGYQVKPLNNSEMPADDLIKDVLIRAIQTTVAFISYKPKNVEENSYTIEYGLHKGNPQKLVECGAIDISETIQESITERQITGSEKIQCKKDYTSTNVNNQELLQDIFKKLYNITSYNKQGFDDRVEYIVKIEAETICYFFVIIEYYKNEHEQIKIIEIMKKSCDKVIQTSDFDVFKNITIESFIEY